MGAFLLALHQMDMRMFPSGPGVRQTFGIPGHAWRQADQDCHDKWHRANLRMSRITFDRIVATVYQVFISKQIRPPSSVNSKLDFRAKMAMTIFYLAGNCNFREISNVFCYSKAGCVTNINKILDVLQSMLPDVVKLPSTHEAW